MRLSVGPGYLLDLLQAETWTNYMGQTERITELGPAHAWNILSHTRRHASELVDLGRRLFPEDRLLGRSAVTPRDAEPVVELLWQLGPVAWVQATPAWHAIALQLVAVGELSDPALAVEGVLQRAQARGLEWELDELHAALGASPS